MQVRKLLMVAVGVLAACAVAHGFEIVIETPTHHLGDDNSFPWEVPTAAGGTWTSTGFDAQLPAGLDTAFLVFDTFDNIAATVSLNGTVFSIPDHNDWSWQNNVTVAFDPSLLRQTGNVIRFDCPWDGQQWDDFMFRNVRITPEPSACALLVLGGLVAMRGRRAYV